ncbi:MAG TPA: hypothetical protein VNZ64_21465 [Candidatus Acidoferrum sp.]|nr:hypothetical protein [Candidatus Acidoferrum sp.]
MPTTTSALKAFALTLLACSAASAQNWQFAFDPSGNFIAETNEFSSLPQIVGQPQMQVVQSGELASFFVVALDSSGLSYQWLFNGTNLPGATGDALLLSNITSNNQGYYSVVLTNGSGSVTSSPAPLWIDSRGCGMPDWWQLYYFGNMTNLATGDYDGDGVSNLQEFLDGTNPTNSASARYRLALFSDGGLVQVTPNQSSYSNGDVVTLTATAMAPGTFHAWTGDVVSQSNSVTFSMNTNKTVLARFTPIDFFWANGSGGDWSVPANWRDSNFTNTALVPLATDNAHITLVNITVTVTNPTECLGLFLGDATGSQNLSGSGTLLVHGPSFWAGGQMSGSGTTIIDTTASLTISNQGTASISRTLENGGTILWTGGGNIVGGGGVITNRPGALFEQQGSGSFANTFGDYRFDNAGTLRKSVSPGTNTVYINLNNYGTLDIEAGTFWCNHVLTNTGTVFLAPGTTNRLSAGGLSSGAFTVPATALVEWTGGTFVNAGGQLNGSGLYRINGNGASLVANTDQSVSNLDLVGPGSALDGSGTVTVDDVMNWTKGNMTGSGRTVIPPGATLNLANASGVSLSRILDNGGTILWTGGGTINFSSGVLTNRAGALFLQRGAGSFSSFNAPYEFDNAGVFHKMTDPGTNLVAINFNNYGTVDLEAGTLTWSRYLTNTGTLMLAPGTTNRFAVIGALSGGPINAPPTALVELTSGMLTLIPGAQLNGGGLYRLNGGALLANTDLSVSNLDYVNNAGDLDGSSAVTINRLMNWTTGTMTGSGRTVIAPGATLNVASPGGVVLSRTLENGGTTLWTGGGTFFLSSGLITNRPGAVFEAQNAASFSPFNSPYRFDNAGIFRKSVSTGTTTVGVPFTNYGTVDLRLGVLAANNGFVSAPGALLNCALGGTIAGTSYGQLQVAGAVTLNGALGVVLTNGFIPATNNAFTLLTAGTRNGTFANFYYPSNAVTMQLSNTTSSVIVQVTGVAIPPPLLLTPAIAGSNVLLTWTAFPNVTYRMEFNPDLGPSNWTALAGDVTSSSNFASKLDPLTPSNRFYRVRLLP